MGMGQKEAGDDTGKSLGLARSWPLDNSHDRLGPCFNLATFDTTRPESANIRRRGALWTLVHQMEAQERCGSGANAHRQWEELCRPATMAEVQPAARKVQGPGG